ncbi:MAG TPA: hypothetical protein VFS58_15480 [Steroidobacteraceae bacterium]|nr:hypothetical protein [Steroidobacteraceae bacterium]
MTTTVRILGSRSREQMPGTGITLLAPGFLGALTQLTAGDAPVDAHDLPFAEAAAGAEVMLAAQLTLNIEARPAGRTAGLRSRSAVAAHPRVIVPRRGGVAYAMLQTDETGVSSFVLPLPHDAFEATFPLTISAHGATRRTLRVLMWPAPPATGAGVLAIAARWERLRRPNQLAQRGPDGDWLAPDWPALTGGPVLLLLHDTFSTPQSSFADWLDHPSFASVLRAFGGRCLAYAHPTLSSGLDDNVSWLVSQVAGLPGPFDVVALGRGGLLARAIAADGRLNLRRVCQVGAPNKGTPLAHEANLLRFLDGHLAMLACIPHRVARTTLEGVLCMARAAALKLPASLPGVAVQATGNPELGAQGAMTASAQQWFTVGAQFAREGGHDAPLIAGDGFAASSNDLVVPSEGCFEPGVPVADELRISGAQIHHHNYFASPQVRAHLAQWLCPSRM